MSQKSNFNNFKRTEIIQSIFFDHNRIKLEINIESYQEHPQISRN